MQCRGFGPNLTTTKKSPDFSRIVMGTRGILSSFTEDYPSKLVFVQGCQDSRRVRRETSGISMRFGRAIQTFLKVRQ